MGINKNSENEKIRKSVDEFYRKISQDEYRTEVSPEEVSTSLGYSTEMMEQLPKGTDLGLSCGNPLENFELKKVIKKAGFKNIIIIKDEVTDAYAEKWGYGLKIKEYIQRGMIMGEK